MRTIAQFVFKSKKRYHPIYKKDEQNACSIQKWDGTGTHCSWFSEAKTHTKLCSHSHLCLYEYLHWHWRKAFGLPPRPPLLKTKNNLNIFWRKRSETIKEWYKMHVLNILLCFLCKSALKISDSAGPRWGHCMCTKYCTCQWILLVCLWHITAKCLKMGPVFRPPAQTSLPLSPSKLSTPPPPSLLRSLAVAMAWRNWSAESCAKCQRSSSLNASLKTKWLNGQSKPLVNSPGTKIADTSAELMGTLTPPIWQTIRVFDAAHVQFMLKILMGSIAPTSPSYTCYTEGVQRQNHKVVCDVNDLSNRKHMPVDVKELSLGNAWLNLASSPNGLFDIRMSI